MAREAEPRFSLLMILVLYVGTGAATKYQPSSDHDGIVFVKTSCNSTTLYPNLCMQSLLPYATQIHQSPRQLVLFALSVSKSRTRSAKTFVSKLKERKNLKPREYEGIAECLNQMSDSMYYLGKSVRQLRKTKAKGQRQANGKDYSRRTSAAKAWVNAALTDDETCLDGFADRTLVKDLIHSKIVNAAQHTSNALALLNKFVY
ncbi:21 kDa protein-like [Melia azedarach]|uniref:21 kDa protein-like n=1 Tax=Melia azedarach TaxID=155640 RepID=A0ACC1X545_MELAZ|nr:21 kDa protein-like [Melia azedarach]